jgi:hypothetical protein
MEPMCWSDGPVKGLPQLASLLTGAASSGTAFGQSGGVDKVSVSAVNSKGTGPAASTTFRVKK